MREILLATLATLCLGLFAPALAQQPSPQISSLSLSTARAGDQIVITGSGFGSPQGNGNVWLGSTYGVVVSWSDSQVVATVASGSKTGVAQVLQGGIWSNAVDFTVITPNISSVSPATAVAGTQVTITGTGFGASQGSGNVWLGSTYGVLVGWSDTQIVANVASGSKSGVAQVLQGGVWSNTVNLTVSTPNITSVTPTTAIAGTQVTITGTGFGASQGSGNVWLGSTYGTLVSWSDTQIVANVASGSKSGVAQVLQGGVWSNTVNLTVSTPNITSVTPTTAIAGTQITITGAGFGASQGSGNVWLGSTYGVLVSWSDTQIVANVASGSKSGVAQVLQGGVWSNTVNLTVSTPNITSVTPTTAIAGTQITITGAGFGASQGSGNVWLGSTYGVLVSWSDTQIVAKVASGSKSGVAQVLQGGVWSNTVNLTVSTPNITSVTPTTAIAGTQITITGTGFGASQGNGNVWLGSTYGAVVSWSDTQVVASVVSGSNSGAAQVLQGGVWSNSVNLTTTTATPPTITASASPASSASGWNNSAVTVTFTCNAGSAAIANCPSPQTVSSEGSNQIVSGTATDANGLTAATSVTLNIDKTQPILAVTSPADGTGFSNANVTVSGAVSDALSGVSSVTCNGAAASFSGGNFSCNISLTVGVNLVVVRVTDLAGNVSGSNFHLTLTGTLPTPNSIQITPSGVNMLVGETRQFTAVDEQGHPRSDATWTISDTSLATITTEGSPTLTALAVGQVTLTATIQSVTVQVQVNILAGTSLAAGTVLWSAPPVPGFGTGAIIQAVPTAGNTPDVYAIDYDSNGNTLIRGFSADGLQMMQVSTASVGAGPDGLGGLLLTSGSGVFPFITTTISARDGVTGTSVWNYSALAQISAKAIRQDGTVFFIETTPPDSTHFNSDSSSLVALDGTVGTPLLRLPLPSSTFKSIDCNGVLFRDFEEGPFRLSNQAIDSDGTVLIALEVETSVTNFGCDFSISSEPFISALSLFQLKPDGSTSLTPIHTYSTDLAIQTGRRQVAVPWKVIPDGQGGSLVGWTGISNDQPLLYITHLSASGQNDYPFPSLDPIIGSMVLGDNGTAYATDDQTIVAFDINSGQTLWSYTSQALDGIAIIASSAGGGVITKEYSGARTGMITLLDAIGHPSPLTTTPDTGFPIFSWHGNWHSLSSGPALARTALPVGRLAASIWASPGGDPSGIGAGRPWYFILNWQNAFDFIPDVPTYRPDLKTDITSNATTIKATALQALKSAYRQWPVVVVEGTPGTGDHQALVQTSPPDQGLSCGSTNINVVHPVDSEVWYECNMEQAQVALQVAINNTQDETNALHRQDLIQAIGRGIGNTSAHEIAHQFLIKCCSMDVFTSDDPASAGTYNNGDADGDPNPQIINSDPAPYTGYGKSGKPIFWEDSTKKALGNCLGKGWHDYTIPCAFP